LPLRSQHGEKAGAAAVADGHVNDLRWHTEQESTIVKVNILTEDNEIVSSCSFPDFCIRRR
jgi:hypothetical protein